jgi:hypothetical protein
MKTMNLGSDDEPVTKKKKNSRNLKIALGLAAVILVPTVGSTLAGTITINTNGTDNQTTFAQGSVAAVACDSDINIVPSSTVASSIFYLDKIVISDIDPACNGKTFNIRVVDTSFNNLPIGNVSDVCSFIFIDDGLYTIPGLVGGCVVEILDASSTSFGFYIYGTNQIPSLDVSEITIETTEG